MTGLKTAAVVENGVVINVVVVHEDADYEPPTGVLQTLEDDSPVTLGYRFDGESFSPPED